MTRISTLILLPLSLVLVVGAAGAQDRALEQRVALLVERLGDADFQTRESASRELVEIGDPARPALRRAAASADPEISFRARKLLEEIDRSQGRPAPEAEPRGPRSRGPDDPPDRPRPRPQPVPPIDPLEGMRRMMEGLDDPQVQRQLKDLGTLMKTFEELSDPDPARQNDGARRLLEWTFDSTMRDLEGDPQLEREVDQVRKMMDWAFEGLDMIEEIEDPRARRAESPREEPADARLSGYRGLSAVPLDPALRAHLKDVPEGRGLLVKNVRRRSQADQLGLETGDLILEINDRPITTVDDYRRSIEAIEKGGAVRIELLRKGDQHEIETRR